MIDAKTCYSLRPKGYGANPHSEPNPNNLKEPGMKHTKILATLFSGLILAACSAPPSASQLLDDSNETRTTDPLDTERVVDIADFAGQTFYQAMMADDLGIIDQMTADQNDPFAIRSADEILATLNEHYTSKVVWKVGSQSDLTRTVRELRRESDRDGYSTNDLKRLRINRAQLEIIGLASGAGVQVVIDDDNYFYNISYRYGERKPGRSYGVGPDRKSDDTSYPDYFERMQSHLAIADDEEIEMFYASLYSILTKNDVTGVDFMNKYGENLLTDFVTVYVAEAYRKLTGGSGGAFHQDLTETTLLAAWSERTGKVPSANGERFRIVDGDLKRFINRSENGSGLGFHNNRRRLQKLVCEAVRDMDASVIEAIEDVTGSTRRYDCYQTAAWILNNRSSQSTITERADDFTKAVTNFVMFTRANADAILERID